MQEQCYECGSPHQLTKSNGKKMICKPCRIDKKKASAKARPSDKLEQMPTKEWLERARKSHKKLLTCYPQALGSSRL